MEKKVYTITGFECANCASKVEEHLNKNEKIAKARIDFAGDKLYLTFKDEILSINDILNIIKEVESDEIIISEGKITNKHKIFSKDLFILLGRILFVILVIILSFTVFKDSKYYWVNFSIYLLAILVITYDIFYKVILHIIHKKNPIDEYLLITISAIGAFVLASIKYNAPEFLESVMVVTLFQVGRVIEGIATNKSKEAINNALDLRSTYANLVNGNDIKQVEPSTLHIGDIIIVKQGELIPIDGIVIDGSGYIDTSSLTGEFVPVKANINEEVYSGCVLKDGTLKLKVNKEYSDSTVSKLIELISHSGEYKSKADKFVTKFARIYTPCVLVAAVIVFLIGGLITKDYYSFSLLGLKLLVVACPCAIVISVPMAYFSAIGLASKNGIVVKGTNYLDEINRIKKIMTDKTGTLTKGNFDIISINPINKSNDDLLEYIAIAEQYSNHPIAKAILKNININKDNIATDYKEIPGYGVSCIYKKKLLIVGNFDLMMDNNVKINKAIENGVAVYCAYNNEFIGYIILGDEIREQTQEFISFLKDKKIEPIILSGDNENNVHSIAEELDISIAYSALKPEEKIDILQQNKSNNYAVGYIGDGVNDASCIKAADVGFAMGGIGSDISVNNADVVIMNDNLMKVKDVIKIASIARRTSIFNIVVALLIKFGIEIAAIVTSSLGRGELIPMWAAVLADTGLTVALVINSLLVLYRKIK